MKKTLLFILAALLTISGYSQNDIRISGRVTDGKDPIPDVSIQVPDTEISTFTDSQGRYSITLPARETIVFSYTGLKTIEYIAEDINSVVNLEMYPDVQYLDEVVIKTKRKTQKILEEEYATNKRIIKTAFGYIDPDRVGYRIQVLDGDDLSPAGIDFLGALQNFVPAMRIYRPNGISAIAFLPRRFGSIQNPRPVAYEVDGLLMRDAPIDLNIFNIERIAVINSATALNRYGQMAAGGLIIINTKGGVFDLSARRASNQFDQAKRWDNVFEKNKLGRVSRVPLNQTLEKFQNIDNKKEALAYLEEGDLLTSLTVYNQIEVANMVLNRWNDQEHYLGIMKNIAEKHQNNAVILKTAAYLLEDNGYLEEAFELYKDIMMLRPNYAQSYRDLADASQKIGDTQKAIEYLGRYIRYVSLDTLSVPAQGIDSLIFTEYDNLLARSGSDRYDKRIASPGDRGGVRMLFEWTHGDSEFELQFVNPENRYFTWQHSLKVTPDRIRDEKVKGYSSEQFFIDESMPGRWQVNMKYLGNKSFDPTYLRVTVYYNYGTPFEKKDTFVRKLSAKNVNYKLLSFINSPIVSSVSR